MTNSERRLLDQFSGLIRDFLDGRGDAVSLKDAYMKLWVSTRDMHEHYQLNKLTRNAIDRAFSALDSFSPDDDSRREHELSVNDLKRELCLVYADLVLDENGGEPGKTV